MGASSSSNSDPTLKNCLFGAVTLTKNADIENMDILVMGLDFVEDQAFHFLVVDLVKMYYFWVDTSSSPHIDNKKKDILVLGKGPTQGLESTLTAEKMYSINFTLAKKRFCFSLHYNGTNS